MGDQKGVDLLSFLSPEHPGDRPFQVEAIQLVDGGREVFHPRRSGSTSPRRGSNAHPKGSGSVLAHF